jgi:hypothetical protein
MGERAVLDEFVVSTVWQYYIGGMHHRIHTLSMLILDETHAGCQSTVLDKAAYAAVQSRPIRS